MPAPPSAGTHDADVAVLGAGAAGLYAALCAAADGRARGARLSHAARPDRQLLGAGRARGRARRQTTVPTCICVTPSSRDAGWCGARRRRYSSPRRPAACAICRRSACASTPIVSGTWRSGSRAGTRSGASSTPAAAPPAGASFASSPRSQPASRVSPCSRVRAHRRCGARTSSVVASSATTGA